MVQKAMKFTPEVLISAPRRSAGVPNSLGTKVLYTTSTYSFQSHSKRSSLSVLYVDTGESVVVSTHESVSDPTWLNEDTFVFLQGSGDGSTLLQVRDASRSAGEGREQQQYVAGTFKGAVNCLKVIRLDEEGKEYGFVVAAQVAKDGSIFDPDQAPKTQSTGRLYSSLFVRHWDQWEVKEKNALWYGKLSMNKHDGRFSTSGLNNALRGTQLESPILPFGGTDNFDISRDGIIFVAKDPDLDPALNTKSNVYLFHINSWEGTKDSPLPKQLIIPGGFESASTSPVISPDGSKAAFLSMRRAGYEADRNLIFVVLGLNLETPARSLAVITSDGGSEWDRSPSSICFTADSNSLLIVAEDYGRSSLFMVDAERTFLNAPKKLTHEGSVGDCKPLIDGRIFISGTSIVDNSFYAMVDTFASSTLQGDVAPKITTISSNSNGGDKFGLSPKQVSSIYTPASNPKINKYVHAWVIKPSTFDSGKKYPVAYLIHGGPQGSWMDSWSTRWNPAVFAEQGYIVIAPNITGSTGYGQDFTDSINRNWGGDPYQDIVNCFEWVGEHMPEADNDRAVALGASFGGYMTNWIQGHDLGRRFKALVCHDGILSTAGMLATEELYFPFFDLGGTPWYDPDTKASDQTAPAQAKRNFTSATMSAWRKWDPSEHFSNWSTPQLVIHSEKDYRICISDGLAAFNVLQARGVESQFLTFPDENHFVTRPENSLVWHKVVLNWINKHVGLPAYVDEDPDGEDFWGGIRGEKEEITNMQSQGKPET